MDANRFDDLARAAAQPGSRRRFLAGLGGGLLAAAVSIPAWRGGAPLQSASAQSCEDCLQTCQADCDDDPKLGAACRANCYRQCCPPPPPPTPTPDPCLGKGPASELTCNTDGDCPQCERCTGYDPRVNCTWKRQCLFGPLFCEQVEVCTVRFFCQNA
jgi:hypothetical protein